MAEAIVQSKGNSPVYLTVGKDGRLIIPTEIIRESGLKAGSKVLVGSSLGQIIIVNPEYKELMEAFILETQDLVGKLEEDTVVFDGLTVQEYFALPDVQRAALWNKAYAEACDELEDVEEIEIGPEYVPAGQRCC